MTSGETQSYPGFAASWVNQMSASRAFVVVSRPTRSPASFTTEKPFSLRSWMSYSASDSGVSGGTVCGFGFIAAFTGVFERR